MRLELSRLYCTNNNTGTTYIVKSTTENNTIDPGKSASFSYTVFGNNLKALEKAPKSFRLVSKRVVLTDGYSVNIKSNANKKKDFEASITIKNTEKNPSGNNGKKNTGKNVIDAWTLSFDANFTLENVNRGTFTVDENGRYTITGTGIISIIRPNVSVQLDISGTKTPNVKPEISNIVLTSVKIDNTITPPEDGDDENPNTTEIALEAWAEYNENTLTLLWASSISDGSFIIYTSDNGTDFEKLTTLENATSYVYTEPFTKKYFKIVQKYDSITVESPIITAEKTSDGYVDLSYFDTDGDGLSDYEESILLTDKTKPDTDQDGLTDYEEVYLTGTDPLVYDSAKPGTSDAQADIDSDGLTNRDEIDRGTNPASSDSDYDNLKDGEEVNTYNTDPLKFDTDGDGVSDSDELQLGLNPLATSTDGTPDNEKTFEQTLSADSEPMTYINSESDLKFSVSITSAGAAENNLNATVSGYSAAIGNNNPAIVGVIPEFSYTENLAISEFTLGVKIPDSLVSNTVGTYAADNDEFAGIKRLNFFRFFEEINTLLPVETTFDVSANMMYTMTDDLGTYCVIDMEIWLESLTEGMDETGTGDESSTDETDDEIPTDETDDGNSENDIDETSDEIAENDVSDNQGDSLPENGEMVSTFANQRRPLYSQTTQANSMTAVGAVSSDREYNVIFCVDTRDTELVETYESYIKTTIYSLRNSTRPKANIYWCDKFGNNGSDLWNSDENKDINLYYKDSSVKFDPASAVTTGLNLRGLNLDLETYVFIVFSATEVESSSFSATNLLEKIAESNKEDMNLHISVISDSSTYVDTAFLPEIIESAQGTIIAPRTADEVSAEVLEYLGAEVVTKIIDSSGLRRLGSDFSKAKIIGYYQEYITGKRQFLTDTDGDSLENYREIDFKSDLINVETMTLPTLSECIDNSSYTYVVDGLDRYKRNKTGDDEDKWESLIKSVLVLPIFSDPTSVDGDEDGILDINEFEWNGIDELYKDVSPLKADTVESIYSDLPYNSDSNPIYLDIRGNHIKINIRYDFTSGDSGLGKYELFDGAEYVWSHSYDTLNDETDSKIQLPYFKGKLYDFYPGMKITVELNFIEQDDEEEDNSIDFFTHDETTGSVSYIKNSSNEYWNNNNLSEIHLHRTQVVGTKSFTDEQLYYEFSHELGHAMGLADAYGSVDVKNKIIVNDGFGIYTDYLEIDPNLEFPVIVQGRDRTYEGGEIMIANGLPCSNDIEMILQSFVEGSTQWFYVNHIEIHRNEKFISKAIKNPLIIYEYNHSGIYHRYDRDKGTYPAIGNEERMKSYVAYNIKT